MNIGKLLEPGGLGKNILIYGAANGLAALSPFVLIPILTRYLTPAEFGEYAMFLLLFNLATILLGLNTHSGLAVNYHKEGVRYPSLLLAGMQIPLAVLLIAAVCLSFTASLLTDFLAIGLATMTLAIGAGFFNTFYTFALTTFQASNRAVWFLGLKILQASGDVLATLAFVITLSLGLLGRTTAHMSVIFLCMLVAFVILKRGGDVGKVADKGGMSYLLRFGVPLVPHALAGSALMFVDRIVLTNLYSIDVAGLYMVALQIAMGMLVIVEPVNKALAPWLFKNLRTLSEDQSQQIVHFSYVYFLILLAIAMVLYAMNDLIFFVLVDQSFHGAKEFSVYLYLGFSFQGMYYTVTNYLLFKERTALLAVVSCSIAVTAAAMSYYLASVVGPLGAAISFMLSNLLLFLAVWALAAKHHPMPWLPGMKARIDP